MTVTSSENGQQNIFPKEPQMTVADHPWGVPHNEFAEKLNGRAAMCGIIFAFISYALTGKLFFGVW
jgi:hypothetical protein